LIHYQDMDLWWCIW